MNQPVTNQTRAHGTPSWAKWLIALVAVLILVVGGTAAWWIVGVESEKTDRKRAAEIPAELEKLSSELMAKIKAAGKSEFDKLEKDRTREVDRAQSIFLDEAMEKKMGDKYTEIFNKYRFSSEIRPLSDKIDETAEEMNRIAARHPDWKLKTYPPTPPRPPK